MTQAGQGIGLPHYVRNLPIQLKSLRVELLRFSFAFCVHKNVAESPKRICLAKNNPASLVGMERQFVSLLCRTKAVLMGIQVPEGLLHIGSSSKVSDLEKDLVSFLQRRLSFAAVRSPHIEIS